MIKRKPEWLRIDMKAYQPKELKRVQALIEKTGLHTVCQEANYPINMSVSANARQPL